MFGIIGRGIKTGRRLGQRSEEASELRAINLATESIVVDSWV